jgi:hypothetical protein
MQNPGNQNAARSLPIENNMPALFKSAQAGTNPHFSHAQLRGGFELMAVRAAVVYWRQRGSGEIF